MSQVEGEPLYTAKYKLDDAMVHKAAGLMTYGRNRVLLGGFVVVVAVAVAFYMSNASTLMFALLAFAAILFSASVMSGWNNIQLNRLAKAGVIADGGSGDELRRCVDVYADHLDLTSLGVTTSYPLDKVEKVCEGHDLCVIDLGGERFALVPMSCMSAARYRQLVDHLRSTVREKAFK